MKAIEIGPGSSHCLSLPTMSHLQPLLPTLTLKSLNSWHLSNQCLVISLHTFPSWKSLLFDEFHSFETRFQGHLLCKVFPNSQTSTDIICLSSQQESLLIKGGAFIFFLYPGPSTMPNILLMLNKCMWSG